MSLFHRPRLKTGQNHRHRNAVKTHCHRGHPLSGEGVYIDANGARQCKECNRLRMRLRADADRGKFRQHARKYYDKNKESILLQNKARRENVKKFHFFIWRASRHKDCKNLTAGDLARLWKKQRGRCALTGVKLDRSAHLDHVTPASRGGITTIENLRWLSPKANTLKGNHTDEELLEICSAIVKALQNNG